MIKIKNFKKIIINIFIRIFILVLIGFILSVFYISDLPPPTGDTLRINTLRALQAGIEQYNEDYKHYPDNIELIKGYLNKIPKDSIDGQIINGCKFGYKYKVLTSKDGKKNGAYSLSTCFENKSNIVNKAAKDGGADPLRYEVGNY